jgi:hypothetical protein
MATTGTAPIPSRTADRNYGAGFRVELMLILVFLIG